MTLTLLCPNCGNPRCSNTSWDRECKLKPRDPTPEGFKHCDSYIHDFNQPMCLRWFIFVNRVPAVDNLLMLANGVKEPKLFADYKGRRVRVTMASRMGDVGITYDLKPETGYEMRVPVSDLSNFSDIG